ncbi:MAG: hypothetical protein ACRDFC_06675 [Ignavibacteria bacterium]
MIKPILYVITFTIIQFIMIPSSYTQPRTILMVTVGYSFPMGDMRGDFGETLATFTGNGNPDSNTYFLKSGFNLGITGKHSLIKKGNLKFVGGVGYNNFFQNKDYSDTSGSVSIEYNQAILTVSAGAEWAFVPKGKRINPFAGIDITANFFSGTYKETHGDGSIKELKLKSTSRFGLQLNAGIDFPLGNRLGVTAGVKYHMANLIGRESTGDTPIEYSINDKEGTVNNTKYIDRSINYLQLYAGLSFYFGL